MGANIRRFLHKAFEAKPTFSTGEVRVAQSIAINGDGQPTPSLYSQLNGVVPIPPSVINMIPAELYIIYKGVEMVATSRAVQRSSLNSKDKCSSHIL